jgi:hypothetical protein
MHMTTSYTQRKGGPRYVRTIYKCSQTGYDKTTLHTSIGCDILDKRMPTSVFSALADLVGRGLDKAETPPEVAPLLGQRADLNERRERAQAIALMPGADLRHLRGELAAIDARVVAIDAEVEGAYRNRARRGALAIAADVIDLFRQHPDEVLTSADLTQLREIRARFDAHWSWLSQDEQRELIRATLSITVNATSAVRDGVPRVAVDYLHLI